MRVRPSTGPPVAAPEERVVEPCLDLSRRSQAEADDPFPDYDTGPVEDKLAVFAVQPPVFIQHEKISALGRRLADDFFSGIPDKIVQIVKNTEERMLPTVHDSS